MQVFLAVQVFLGSSRQTSYKDPLLSQLANRMCIIIDDATPPQPPIGLTITRAPSDVSNIDQLAIAPQPPIVNYGDLPPTPEIPFYTRATTNLDTQQDNCSALAHHLFAHVKNLRFDTKAEVAKWCRTNITVDILLWRLNTISLVKTAGQKVWRLCATKHMIIGQNFTSTHRQRKILNLKSEMRSVCSCKARFLRFARSD